MKLPPGISPSIDSQLAAVVTKRAALRGLVVVGQALGRHQVVRIDGLDKIVTVDTSWPYYQPVRADEVMIKHVACEMVDAFAARHGQGRVWYIGPSLVHIVNDDGVKWVRADSFDGYECRLRMLAAHEESAKP